MVLAGVPARNAPQSDPTIPIPGRLFAGPGLAQPSGVSPADDNAATAIGLADLPDQRTAGDP